MPGPLELIIIIGILLTPLVLALVAYLIARKGVSYGAGPRCPQCGSETVPGAAFCYRCGNQLPSQPGR
jgi:uncharacterized OB-fold protein